MSSPRSNPVAPQPRRFAVEGTMLTAPSLAPGLYLVATPIGNLGDITLRAMQTLAAADLIACEDTRITRRLTERYAIAAPLSAYHEHNATLVRPKLLAALADGAAVALVSDAGTPLISDPGFKLVREATVAGHAVTAVPGASAVLAALSVSALPTDRFLFEGFLPPKQAARAARLTALASIDATLVLFETGPRIAAALRDMAQAMPDREAAICRELTKLHEEVTRGALPALADAADALETRGEFVVVIAPPHETKTMSADDLDAVLRDALAQDSLRDAVAQGVAASGLPRRDVYARALALTKAGGDAET